MKWTTQVYLSEIRKVLAYRFDFWVQLVFSIFAHLGTAYFLWRAVFDYRDAETLRGYSLLGLMFYHLMLPSISRMIYGPGLGNVAHEIYDGSLNRYLVYPVSFFGFKYAQYLANATVFAVQFVLTIAVFAAIFGVPVDVHFSPATVAMGFGAILLAGLMAFALSTAVEMVAFWADNVWSLLVMIRFSVSLLGGAMIPLAFFPERLRQILHYLPFSTLAALPIESFLGKVTFAQWLTRMGVGGVWAALFVLASQMVWNRGKYRYTGVGI
jgi:ABC-2 type transport system permease protein